MDQIANLPDLPGVYFFYNEAKTLVYVGKSINIRSRVKQHFSGKDRKSLKIQNFVKHIEYEVMGNELIALLYESDLIKRHQPLYNRSQRRTTFPYGLYVEDVSGYTGLRIAKITLGKSELTSFSSSREAKEALFRITEKYRLCQKINGLYKTTVACFQYQIKSCDGACISQEPTESYNARVEQFVRTLSIEKSTHLLELRGRTENEIGLVYIENGVYKGFGFCTKGIPKEKYHDFIEERQDNKDVRRILIRHLAQR